MGANTVNVVCIGTGKRALNLYVPAIQAIQEMNLIGICGKDYLKTQTIAKDLKIKPYKNFCEIVNDREVDCVIIAVSWTENKNLYLELAETQIPALIETPLGKDFNEAGAVVQALSKRIAYTDIAEQYHQRPIEQLKRSLIRSGLFGEVFYAFSDGAGHEYHGISLLRSYLGFDLELKKVVAVQKDVPCFPHFTHQNIFFPGERVQHALLEFGSGALAAYHWSWLSYESPIRSRRLAGFHGTKGICSGEDCLIFEDTKEKASRIFFKRKTRVVDGIEVLSEVLAFLEDKLIAHWQNPFDDLVLDEERMVAAIFIKNLIDSLKVRKEPIYSLKEAHQDHFILGAMMDSVNRGEIWQNV